MYNKVLLLVCFIIGYVHGQVIQQQDLINKLVCIQHEECGPCLSAASHCRWCADPYYPATAPRCNDDESLVAFGCGQGMIQRPEKSVWQVSDNRSLQDMLPDSLEAVQIQPQRIKLSLKPRETRKIQFQYRPARNYPLDLYYLMDLTWSMKDDKETLVSLRDDLPEMLKNLTDNFRLGFGSFAEKPVMPFISVDPGRRANPCTVEEEDCEATYSYKHHLSLTNTVNAFIESVNSSSVTANLDNAEAQLDALVQAITCGSRIGWAARSRKIIILLSDGLLHTAGDGKLGGASLKNDETCHLDENGYYSEAAKYDYPSIAQVYRLLDKYKVNVIFAVTESVKDHYDSLHQLLSDFTYIAKLESDSSNILKLVKTGYEDIVSVVDFEDDASSGPVKVKYFTDCGVKGGMLIEARRCSGVEYGMTLNYEAHVTLDSCPEFKKSHQTITISESQLGQDSLTLEVDIQCGCNCESDLIKDMSLTCPTHSHLVCGVCQCNKGWSGPKCDCSIEDDAASVALLSQCREPNSTRLMTCSGAGDCLCGKCECDRGFSGKFCQCKDCEISGMNGMECGGVEHGVCVCGQCACEPGWSGAACDCTTDVSACAPPTGEVCSGHGDCVCGRCECSASADGMKYSGMFCEMCATCENPLCANAEPCVLCHLNNNCTESCSIAGVNYTVSERLHDATEKSFDIPCILRRLEDGLECEYRYTYNAAVQSMISMEIVIRSKECSQPTTAKIMTSAIITMACVILGGIIIILGVKSAQIVSDRRAYAKFLQEAQESRKNMQELNPLYISPISEFTLPESYPRDRND
ncbi:integrin beta-nu [Zerene cesonia]|uniref:integrin beta-nu n=1 Tax=Zerene cesonia TaxID=33412 RepID=UPI0018E4E974|nr:integrin beta-nu [Zerene cesonia]